MFKHILLVSLICLTSSLSAFAKDSPNVIVIMTDDQGAMDMGAYGATDLKTPHLDQLAAEGVRFTQFYAAAPICSSSRAGLLTGRYPARAGVPGNVSPNPGPTGLPLSETTMAEVFKAEGYRTALIGKWHLGRVGDGSPNEHGFDHWFGHAGGCIDNYSHFFYWNGPNRHDLYLNGKEIYRDGKYFPDMMVDEAISFIDHDKEQDQPFFMYFAMNMPHYPYQGDEKWLNYYNGKGVRYPRNLYNAFVSTLDERIGRLLAALDARGLKDDTIVVFQSDHGHSTEERAHGGGGNSGIYRGAKQSVFEGGLRAPAIIRWPGKIPAGEARDQWVGSIDLLPTLAKLAGTDVSKLQLDGKDITPIIQSASAPTPHKSMQWLLGNQWAVRHENWKLMENVADTTEGADRKKIPGYFLVDLSSDPSEKINVAGDHPEQLKTMIALSEKIRVR